MSRTGGRAQMPRRTTPAPGQRMLRGLAFDDEPPTQGQDIGIPESWTARGIVEARNANAPGEGPGASSEGRG